MGRKYHKYTAEQDDFIRNNFKSVAECVEKFNLEFGTSLSYSAMKTHANRKLGLKTGYRPWTEEMNEAIGEILLDYPYKQATEIFNKRFNTNFTQKQVEWHCTRQGISREYHQSLKQIDNIIKENIEKPYSDIREILNAELDTGYVSDATICRRANNMGLSRPHRVWQNEEDRRFINGEVVTFSEYVRFIGNRFHRIEEELQPVAAQIVKLQYEASKKIKWR